MAMTSSFSHSAESSVSFEQKKNFENKEEENSVKINNNKNEINNNNDIHVCSNLTPVSNFLRSFSEKNFIKEGIKLSIRTDGRKLKNFRFGRFCKNLISSANGSASYENFENYVLSVVKFELLTTNEEEAKEGDLNINIDLPACLDKVRFESYIGEEAISCLCIFLKNFCFSSNFFDKKVLCILPNNFYWNMYIDVAIFRMGGNMIDAISFSILAALKNTLIPKVNVYRTIDEEFEQKEFQIEIDDLSSGTRFPCDSIPICITAGQINRCLIWDMSLEEESCADCVIIAAIDRYSNSIGIHKSGGVAIEIGSLRSAISESEKIGKEILRQIDLTLEN